MSLTRQEVFQALADGKEVEFKRKNPKVSAWCAIDNYFNCLNAATFPNREWRIKPKPPKWYEEIPEHGVLCWVGDCKQSCVLKTKVAVIYYYDPTNSYAFKATDGIYWDYAIPLTDEEIKQFLRGEDDAE